MKVKYISHDLQGKEHTYTVSVEEFTVDQVLRHENFDGTGRVKMNLDRQPDQVARVVGRLLDTLITKGVLNQAEFHAILQSDWPMSERADIITNEVGSTSHD